MITEERLQALDSDGGDLPTRAELRELVVTYRAQDLVNGLRTAMDHRAQVREGSFPVIEEDGDIALDWQEGNMMLSLSVAPTGRIAYAWTTPDVRIETHGSGSVHTHPALHEILKAVATAMEQGEKTT